VAGVAGILLYRHAHAGARELWTGDDRLRPLTKKGRRQAEWMAERLAGLPIRRLLTSPYLRCVQTLEPLARRLNMPMEQPDDLAEGASEGRVIGLLGEAMADNSVLCSHGDVIATALDWLQRQRATFHDDPAKAEKGSVWMVEKGTRGLEARYLPVPKLPS
jgi:8-oxo-dGTP diphosphatase